MIFLETHLLTLTRIIMISILTFGFSPTKRTNDGMGIIQPCRYPVILHQFAIRSESGGRGRFRGGHGLVRELEFCEEIKVSILSERRVYRPYGLQGGEAGQVGKNLLLRQRTGVTMNLGGKNSLVVQPGDRLQIMTPGGGGFGAFE